jgi:hemerythrin
MTVLTWSDALAVGHGAMDDTHHEFVEHLNRVATAPDAELLARLDQFIAHTEAHFAQEEAWMAASDFPASACHLGDHQNVLEVSREVRRRVVAGELQYARTLAQALAEWFPLHAGSMDAVLALFLTKGADAVPACSHDAGPCHTGEETESKQEDATWQK